MRKTMIALLAATAAMLALTFAATTATASRSLEVRPNATSASGRLTFESPLGRIICSVTLLRTLSRVIPKIEGTLMGRITGVAIEYESRPEVEPCEHSATIRHTNEIIALRIASAERLEPTPCSGGTGRTYLCDVSGSGATLWKLVYRGFRGILPEISGIDFEIGDVQFKIDFTEVFGRNYRCLYRGTIPVIANVSRRTISSGEGRGELALFKELTASCPAARLVGRFNINPALTIALL